MRKFFIAVLLVLLSVLPLAAGDYHDVALGFGHQTYKWPEKGISLSYSLSIGLTERMELDIWGNSELVPRPFGSNLLGAELSFALMGPRSTASRVAGSGINTLLSVGGFYRIDNNGAGPMIAITPLTVGSPITGHRERILRTGVGYDFVNWEFVITFSLISIDYYVRGSWRDYEF
ncbi:MAG: hypothetical protein IAA72_03765 [Spirochaetes bacterium]|uniref:Outer membrane protein beta-barrel domain-containing protein n=1 Tax=Candidatus Ornithospirochaeta stercoravium TaxID=2840897 RepID=A0A9D9IA89_9SPIO|nr:hypothetical protein [Candidatus Ornithospirochaeta stercoravium]